MKNAHEFVIFKFKDGVNLEKQKELMAKIDSCAKKLDGFMNRQYFYSNGSEQWIDHVSWENHDYAQKASDLIMQDPQAQEIFQHIDETTITMSHFDMMN
jgi:hypothetical protein